MEPGDRITAPYHRVWERAAEATGHRVERVGGATLVCTGAPVNFFNRAFVQADPEDPAATLEEAERFFGDLPFLFEVRPDLHLRAARAATGRGLAVAASSPGMVMSPIDVDGLSAGCEGLAIRTVSSDDLNWPFARDSAALAEPARRTCLQLGCGRPVPTRRKRNMTLIRKIVVAAGIAGALLIPFTVTTATPAAAYCQAEPVDNGGNGCANSCEDSANTWRKLTNRLPDEINPGDPWLCPQ